MNIGEILIKKGVPIPEPTRIGCRHPITQALAKMEPGDCIDLPYTDQKAKSDLYAKAKTARIKVTLRVVEHNGMKIVRCWRIQNPEDPAKTDLEILH